MKATKLTTSESVLLDVIRVCAAIVVAIGHLTQPYFSRGLPNLVYAGRSAVGVFFVLSGFVIRYVTVQRPGTMKEYLTDRASRIYSVALPAMALTIAADAVSQVVNPSFYSSFALSRPQAFFGVVTNLTFLAQIWTVYANPLSNLPFWSLNYEVFYYVLYACMFYLVGTRRWVWTLALALLAGPKILLLLPTWLLGCWAYDLYQRWGDLPQTRTYLNIVSIFILAGAVFLAADRSAAHHVMRFYNRFYLEGKRLQLGRTSGVIDFYAVSFVATVFTLRMLLAVRGFQLKPQAPLVRWIRYIAEGTFPIYLLHFPLFVLIAACLPYNHGSLLQKSAILVATIGFGVFLGQVCNVLKLRLRSVLSAESTRTSPISLTHG